MDKREFHFLELGAYIRRMTEAPVEVRQVKITGGAADDYHKLKRGGSRRKPKVQQGGDDVPGPAITGPANFKAARNMMNGVKIMKGGQGPAGPSTLPGSNPQDATVLKVPAVIENIKAGIVSPVNPMPSAPAISLQTASSAPLPSPPLVNGQTGGAKGKLMLVPPKKKTRSRLILAPPATTGRKTSKIRETRKIRVQLSGLKKRMTKAKAIHKDSREKTIGEIRKLLEEAKLVKPAKDGKAVPDSVLRDIYKDYLLLRNRAL